MGGNAVPPILVVDDEPDIVLLCRVNLEHEGFTILEAADGAEALRLARERRPALVLLDATMPGMDGWDVLAALKAEPACADIPVVMLTGRVGAAERRRALDAGATAYVTKPFLPSDLVRTVRDVIDPKART